MNIPLGKDMIAEWGLRMQDFDNGQWGNLIGKFKVYRSLAQSWVTVVASQTSNGAQLTQKTDIDKIFEEIIIRYITSFYANIYQLQVLSFRNLSRLCKGHLRNAVLQAVAWGLKNRTIMQSVIEGGITGGGMQAQVTTSISPIRVDWWGPDANDLVMISGIFDYEILGEDELAAVSANGNKKIVRSWEDAKGY